MNLPINWFLRFIEQHGGFPKKSYFRLTSQIRRAVVSVAANIVEGCARQSKKEYLHFLNIAFGSLREVGYYIELAPKLGYVSEEVFQTLHAQYDETAKVLSGLIRSLQNKI